MVHVSVRFAEPRDKAIWRTLWNGYCAFYEVHVPEGVTETTWQRLMAPEEPIFCFVAEAPDGDVVGFANCVVHRNTWSARNVCYLEDLFVDEQHRGLGYANALISRLRDEGRTQGWLRVYWLTKKDNARARAVYKKLAQETDWVRYDVPLLAEGGAFCVPEEADEDDQFSSSGTS